MHSLMYSKYQGRRYGQGVDTWSIEALSKSTLIIWGGLSEGLISLIHLPKEVMHQFKVTLDVLTNKEPAELAYVLTQLFKDEALRVQAFSYEEVSERPTTVEHHGGS
jgi:hypothetical protein